MIMTAYPDLDVLKMDFSFVTAIKDWFEHREEQIAEKREMMQLQRD